MSQLHLVTNEEGWIATVQSMPSLHRDWAGRVLNEKKEVSSDHNKRACRGRLDVPSVIHQP